MRTGDTFITPADQQEGIYLPLDLNFKIIYTLGYLLNLNFKIIRSRVKARGG